MNQIAPDRATPNRQIQLNNGLNVPLDAYALACDLERRGCQLVVDGDDVLVGPTHRITETDRQGIRAYRASIRAILAYRDLVVP